MASIQETSVGWRAQVAIKGDRRSKVFRSEAMAKAWADRVEAQIKQRTGSTIRGRCPEGSILLSMIPQRVLRALDHVPFSLDEVLRASMPYTDRVGIYFLIRKGEVVYIGQSVDVLHRIARQKREGRVFDSFTYFICDPSQLDHFETMYLAAFLPEQNLSLARQRTRITADVLDSSDAITAPVSSSAF